DLWTRTGRSWIPLSIGIIMGCGAAAFKRRRKKVDEGASRLFRIIISEAARLIWTLRCKRRMEHADAPGWQHPSAYIESQWYRIIDERLTTDRLLTNRHIYGKRARNKQLVLATWRGTFDQSSFPDDWIDSPGVLVG
ncbi:hypothetical protein AURDEDRAFT_24257, partial [Auricularia subglabra TFB-10046 SS5]